MSPDTPNSNGPEVDAAPHDRSRDTENSQLHPLKISMKLVSFSDYHKM